MYFNCIRFNPKLFAEAKAKILIKHWTQSNETNVLSMLTYSIFICLCLWCHEEYEAKDSVEVEWFMLTGVAQEWSLARGGE